MSLFKNRTVVGVICILLSLLICFGVTPLFNQSVSQKTEIVRVVKEIKAGEEITKEMVQTAEVGGFGLPENVLRQSESVVGKYATADLFAGDYLLPDKLLQCTSVISSKEAVKVVSKIAEKVAEELLKML